MIDQYKKGLVIKPRDLVIIYFDNVGYKILGRQASYDQWIAIVIVVVTEAQLKSVGFYQNTDDLAQRISREPSASWADLTSRLETPDDKRGIQYHCGSQQ